MKYIILIIALGLVACERSCPYCEVTMVGYNSITEETTTDVFIRSAKDENKCGMDEGYYELQVEQSADESDAYHNALSSYTNVTYTHTTVCN